MIDKQEAEKLVLKELTAQKAGGYEIGHTEEKPYGWISYLKRAEEGPLDPGGCMCMVVEKDTAKISKLSGSFLSVELARFEEKLFWQARYDSILKHMSEQEWKDAEVVVNECLELSAKMSEEVARLGVARSIYNLDNQAREEVSFGYAILFMIKSGELQLRKGNDQEAEAIFLQAKELLDKIHPLSVHAHSADQRVPLLQNLIAHKIKRQQRQLADEFRRELALTYYAAKIDSKAQEVFEEQLQKRSEIYPFGHPAVAQTLTDLARLKNDQSQFYEADIFFEKAVEKWDWLLETPDRLSQVTGLTETAQIKQFYDQASETMQRWANSMRSRGRAEEANRLLEKANQLKSKI